MTAFRVPPGRAGLLRLRHSLTVAQAGADLLARKLTMLSAEANRLSEAADAAGRRWHSAAAEAQQWLERTAQLDGDRVIDLTAPPATATIEPRWTSLMGLRYVTGVTCSLPGRPADRSPIGSSARARAEAAVRTAVPLAAEHAAAVHAVGVVERESRLTRQRLRALERRRIPRLHEALERDQPQTEEVAAMPPPRSRRHANVVAQAATSR
jgi:V/A-type H+-transporting ATPase subunit D